MKMFLEKFWWAVAIGTFVVTSGGGALVAGTEGPDKAEAASPSDWPQWRGPNRDGIASEGPKLQDSWPKEGPKILWKSELIPGEQTGGHDGVAVGGCGSITVSGGRAFLFANSKMPGKGKVYINAQDLLSVGWVDGLPENAIKKIDEAYNSPKRKGLKDAALSAYIDDFLGTLDPGMKEKFGVFIRDKLTLDNDYGKAWSWSSLYRLYLMRDQEFASVGAWGNAAVKLTGHPVLDHHSPRAGAITTMLNMKGFRYTDTVICLDALTGKEIWKKELPGNAGGDTYNYHYGASSTPAISNGKCYVAGSAGVYCLSVTDGALIWQAKAGFSNSSPLVKDGVVFIALPEGLTAYDAKKGNVVWNQPEVSSKDSSFVSWASNGKTFLIGLGYSSKKKDRPDLVCVDPGKGAVLWRFPIRADSVCTPAISGDVAVIFGQGPVQMVKLTPQNGELACQGQLRHTDRGGSALIHQGYVYVGGGYSESGVYCYDLKTGEMKWKQKFGAHCEGPSPMLADGKIFVNVRAETGGGKKTVMIRPNPERYEEIGSLDAPLDFEASPVVAGGMLYLRMHDRVFCYDLAKK